MRNRLVFFLGLALCLHPIPLLAFDFAQIRINGFVSQGYMNTADNDWLATDSTDGTTQINEAGLTVNAPLSDRLRVGFQFLSRDLGDEGNNDVQLDWGFGDYRFHDMLGIRLGKVKLPIGFYNEGRDSDFLRPMAFLPQSIYDETRRNLLVASLGGQLYGNILMGAAGDLDYQVHYGQINFPSDSPTLLAFEQFAQQADMILNMDPPQGPPTNVLTSISADNKSVYGAAVRYNTPIEGLRVGVSYFEGEADFPVKGYTVDTNLPYSNTLRVAIDDMVIGSLEYATPWFTLATEATRFEQPAWYQGVKIAPIGPSDVSIGYYAMLTVPVPGHEKLSFTALYDAFYRDKDDTDGDEQSAATNGQMPDYYFYRKDIGVGARYDINPHWLFKAEWHDLKGADLLVPFYNDNQAAKNWSYYIVKTSFNF